MTATGAGSAPELELEARRRIYAAIRKHPGGHARKLGRILDMPVATLAYHLDALEAGGVVTSRRDRYYRRFYPTHDPHRGDRPVVAALRSEPHQRLLAALLAEGGSATYGMLRARLELPPSTLSLHAKALTESGILERERQGRETLYRVREPDRVLRVLLQHRDSFLRDLVDRAHDLLRHKSATRSPTTSGAETARD